MKTPCNILYNLNSPISNIPQVQSRLRLWAIDPGAHSSSTATLFL